MNTELQKRCDLLVKNRDAIRAAFKWSNADMLLAGSSFYVGLNQPADPEKLKACEALLKEKTGAFSALRGNVKMPVLCKMALAEDPGQYLDTVLSTMEQLKAIKHLDGDYRVLSALTICDHTEPFHIPEAVRKTSELYYGMKENHPWLTSGEDAPFAAMLAVSELDTHALLEEMEACYQELKGSFRDSNAVQSLSHVLALDSSPTVTKCRQTAELFNRLKAAKHKFGSSYELAILGTLPLLDLTVEAASAEIIEADDYLRQFKGFGDFTMGDKTRRMYAALMVMDTHMPPADRSHESLVNSVLAMVIAMEVCMMIVMTSVCISSATT